RRRHTRWPRDWSSDVCSSDLKPSCSRYGVSPAASRYRVTTREPGANVVFTCGFTERPRSIAFFARSPAAIITDGFEVFVQLVIRSEEHTSELQSRGHLVCRLL